MPDTRTLEEKVQYLLDRTEISETVVKYFSSLDHKDWAAMRATLAPTLDLDFEQLFGDPPARHDSDDFAAFASGVLGGFTATQHISPNHVIEIDGDSAICRAYMFAWHTVPTPSRLEDEYLLRGHYVADMVRTDDGWRMSGLHMTVWDEAGDKGTYEVARKRLEALQAEGATA
jgi:hypothetical protein